MKFRVFDLRDKAILKGREKQRDLDQSYIKKLLALHSHDTKLLQEQHYQELINVREREKKSNKSIINELNDELAQLHEEKLKDRKYYNSILQYGIEMEEAGNVAADYFERAKIKMNECMRYFKIGTQFYGEATQLMDMGKSQIIKVQEKISQEKPKLLRRLK
jgi:hypothetical protein